MTHDNLKAASRRWLADKNSDGITPNQSSYEDRAALADFAASLLDETEIKGEHLDALGAVWENNSAGGFSQWKIGTLRLARLSIVKQGRWHAWRGKFISSDTQVFVLDSIGQLRALLLACGDERGGAK